MKKQDKRSIGTIFAAGAVIALFLVGIGMFRGIGGRSYSTVPNYELMARDVKAGNAAIRIPDFESLPEDEYYYMVSYAGKFPGRPAEGYLLHTKSETRRFEVKCHPVEDGDSELEPNMELLGVPVELSETETVENDFWVKQFFIDLEGYRYWVRFESREGIVEDVQPQLEKIAISILNNGPVPTGM